MGCANSSARARLAAVEEGKRLERAQNEAIAKQKREQDAAAELERLRQRAAPAYTPAYPPYPSMPAPSAPPIVLTKEQREAKEDADDFATMTAEIDALLEEVDPLEAEVHLANSDYNVRRQAGHVSVRMRSY